MSYLDNLENSLKSLESAEEGRASLESEQRLRERNRAAKQAAAGSAEELKRGPFTAVLLRDAARVGHSLRTKIHIVWLGSTLRLEAREKRLEFRPTPDGIVTAHIEDGRETVVEPLDLNSDPQQLLRSWLGERPPAPEEHEESQL